MAQRSFVGRIASFFARPGTMVVVAFLIRFGIYSYYRSHGPFPVSETLPIGYETGRIARSLAAGEGYSSPLNVDTGPTAWMTPLFPLLLAVVFKLYGIYSWTSFLVIAAIDCALSALTGWCVWAIARRAFGESCGVAAGWIWVLLPSAVFYPVAWVWDTSLSAFVLALIMLATVYIRGSDRPAAWAGYGALWGAGAMTNASIVSTLPFLIGWAALQLRQKSLPWMRLVVVALLVFTLVISPWFIRNYVVFHKIILLRDNFGLELWLGNNPSNPGIWSWWLHPNDDETERRIYARMGEAAYMELKQREAIAWIRGHPREFAHDTLHRFVDNWTGFDEPIRDVVHGPSYSVAVFLVDLTFPLLAFPGALIAYRQRNPYAFPFAAAMLFFPLVYYVTHTSLRYRHPIDPVLCVLAGCAVVTPFSWLAARRARKSAVDGRARTPRDLTPVG